MSFYPQTMSKSVGKILSISSILNNLPRRQINIRTRTFRRHGLDRRCLGLINRIPQFS